MPSIHFFYEDTHFRLVASRNTKAWIKKIINSEKKKLGTLNYIFCSDSFLAKFNLQYLQHDTYTDIITFDNSEDEISVDGEVYISVERVEENAIKFKTLFDDELHRVIIHGVLHLIGYSDKNRQQAGIMRKKEESCLSLRGK